MSESTSDPKLEALEKSLTALVPVPGRIDRDHLLFRAGQASVGTRRRLWPLIETITSTALLTLVAVGLGMTLVLRAVPVPVERIVYVPVPRPTASDSPGAHQETASTLSDRTVSQVRDFENLWGSSGEYLQQRNQAIRWGVESLPPAPSMASTRETPSVESLLGLPEKKMGQFPLKF